LYFELSLPDFPNFRNALYIFMDINCAMALDAMMLLVFFVNVIKLRQIAASDYLKSAQVR